MPSSKASLVSSKSQLHAASLGSSMPVSPSNSTELLTRVFWLCSQCQAVPQDCTCKPPDENAGKHYKMHSILCYYFCLHSSTHLDLLSILGSVACSCSRHNITVHTELLYHCMGLAVGAPLSSVCGLRSYSHTNSLSQKAQFHSTCIEPNSPKIILKDDICNFGSSHPG